MLLGVVPYKCKDPKIVPPPPYPLLCLARRPPPRCYVNPVPGGTSLKEGGDALAALMTEAGMEEQATRLRRLKVGSEEAFGQSPLGGSWSRTSLIAHIFCSSGGSTQPCGLRRSGSGTLIRFALVSGISVHLVHRERASPWVTVLAPHLGDVFFCPRDSSSLSQGVVVARRVLYHTWSPEPRRWRQSKCIVVPPGETLVFLNGNHGHVHYFAIRSQP